MSRNDTDANCIGDTMMQSSVHVDKFCPLTVHKGLFRCLFKETKLEALHRNVSSMMGKQGAPLSKALNDKPSFIKMFSKFSCTFHQGNFV